MFIEFSREKLYLLAWIVGGLAVAIALFVLVNGLWQVVPQGSDLLGRERADLAYTLLYKWRGDGNTVAAPEATSTAASIPVLLYHGEGTASNMPTSVFLDQMRALKDDGWHTITMEQFDAYMQGTITLPAKSFLLTFDDGRKDTFYQADPVLQDMGFTGVMFVITGLSLPTDAPKSSFYLSPTELQYMAQSGRWELESHGDEDHLSYAVNESLDSSSATTTGHYLSNLFWLPSENRFETIAEFTQRVQGDLTEAKQTLQSDFGSPVIAFAYPFNDFGQNSVNFPGSQQILDQVIPSIYSYAFYQTWPGNGDTFDYPDRNNGPGTSAYMEKRIEPSASWSGQDLIDMLDQGMAKSLPYQSSSFGADWVASWGNGKGGSTLSLSAATSTSGASVFLNGSGAWKNYLFQATAQVEGSTAISLIARNDDDSAYLACAFSEGMVALEEHDGSTQTTIAKAAGADLPSGTPLKLGIEVQGSSAQCFENGTMAVGASFSDPAISMGGIGVEVWNKTIGAAQGEITDVSVSNI